jgi:hypothetical protein
VPVGGEVPVGGDVPVGGQVAVCDADADGDGACDGVDADCNADGQPTLCRRASPVCPEGTVPEVRDNCYTDRCVSWAECGQPVQPVDFCGGFAGVACPRGLECVDDPNDDCSPENGGADCPGVCVEPAPVCEADTDADGRCDADDSECNADGQPLLCRRVAPICPRGTVPEVVNNCYTDVCVTWAECGQPVEPIDFCGGFAGFECPRGLECVDDPNDDCDPANGGADCIGVCLPPVEVLACSVVEFGEFGNCRAVLGWGVGPDGGCQIVSGCECTAACEGRVFNDEASCNAACTPPEPPAPSCGGIAGLRCPRGQQCVDDPNDRCVPANGGADCPGLCVDAVQ